MLALIEFQAWALLAALAFIVVASLGYWFEARSARNAARERAIEVEAMLENSLDLDYDDCRARARVLMDALHAGLEFVDGRDREVAHGWQFEFAIPSGDPQQPWDYLIGCSSTISVNRHTGKAELLDPDQVTTDWMGREPDKG
ncbi:MAG: hypothetical protein DHS20C11_30460 [Lysobacteraceae bacterium]|nr:MAG: hypothetical protein DHS20C11_30460 [Xanthomonadaceae bacterium]